MILVEQGASASIVETHLGAEGASYVNNPVTEVVLGPEARLDRVKLQRDGKEAIHLSNLQARLDRNAHPARLHRHHGRIDYPPAGLHRL